MAVNPSAKKETHFYYPSEAFVENATVSGIKAYRALCEEAEQDYEGFWAKLARENVLWHRPIHRFSNGLKMAN